MATPQNKILIDTHLVEKLIQTQFPQWAHLPIKPVKTSGWDNRTFHLGENMTVRLPSAAAYSLQVEKEHLWLPKLAPCLPLPIPIPLAMGSPTEDYPWHWSIYPWLAGESTATAQISNVNNFAISLAEFLLALQRIDATGGPPAGPHNFYRGGPLTTYEAEARNAIAALEGRINTDVIRKIWEQALATTWQGKPVWVHGDISTGNLLIHKGRLSAVIDFGILGTGDPACDLPIAWTFFKTESRKVFRERLGLDAGTWERALGWTLWKALIVLAGHPAPAHELELSKRVIHEVIADCQDHV